MHSHVEVVMPPTQDVQKSLEQIFAPFKEGGIDRDGFPVAHHFWDWFVIGGRWSGYKLLADIDPQRLEAFQDVLAKAGVTEESLSAGRPALNPVSQIPFVDSLWRESFYHGNRWRIHSESLL